MARGSRNTYLNPRRTDSDCDLPPRGYFIADVVKDENGVEHCVYGIECRDAEAICKAEQGGDTASSTACRKCDAEKEQLCEWEAGFDYKPGMLVRDPIDGCVYMAAPNIDSIRRSIADSGRSEYTQGLLNLFDQAPSQTYNIPAFSDGSLFARLWFKTDCDCRLLEDGSEGVIADPPNPNGNGGGGRGNGNESEEEGNGEDSNGNGGSGRPTSVVGSGMDITVSEDCSGFLLSIVNIYMFEQIYSLYQKGLVTEIKLTITNDLTGDVITLVDGTDADIDYFAGETHANYISETLSTSEYSFLYTVTYTDEEGTTGNTLSISYCGKLVCNCCLKKAAVTIAQDDCTDCDTDFRKKFLKAFALSKALEFASNTLTKAIMKKAIKERDNLVNRITKCRDC